MGKFYIILALCLYIPTVLCLSEEMIELMNQLHSACVEESGVDEALIKKVNTDKVFPDDENLKCYVKCLMSQTASVDDDGVVDVEAVIALLPDDMRAKSESVIRACGAKTGSTPCESVWLTHKCYLEKQPDVYELI